MVDNIGFLKAPCHQHNRTIEMRIIVTNKQRDIVETGIAQASRSKGRLVIGASIQLYKYNLLLEQTNQIQSIPFQQQKLVMELQSNYKIFESINKEMWFNSYNKGHELLMSDEFGITKEKERYDKISKLCLIWGFLIFIGLQFLILNEQVINKQIKLDQSNIYQEGINHQYSQQQINDMNSKFIEKYKLLPPVIQIKPSVYNYGQSKQYPYQLIRATTSDVLTFPQQIWVSDQLQDIQFINFPEYAASQNSTRIQQFLNDRVNMGEISSSDKIAYYYEMLHQYPSLQELIEYEYYYLNSRYHINRTVTEKSFCVVSVGMNIFKKGYHRHYFHNLALQNYTNFRIVWIDDNSEMMDWYDSHYDQIFGIYRHIYERYPRLRRRIKLVKNRANIGAFANKDTGIKENCQPGDIIIDLDSDDALIGRQTLKTLNLVYQQKQVWALYTNFLSNNKGFPYQGFSMGLFAKTNEYRTSYIYWHTTHLKTYLFDVYVKVPLDYLTEYDQETYYDGMKIIHQKFLKYPRHASDQYMFFPVLEMAGAQRVVFMRDLFYYYFRNPSSASDCHRAHLLYDEVKCRVKTPLGQLTNINDPIRLQTNFPKPKTKKVKQLKEQYWLKCRRFMSPY